MSQIASLETGNKVTCPPMGQGRKVLFTAVKNEGPFLLEWIAYHRIIGFDEIVVFSNASDDGTTELLDALASEAIVSHYFHVPPKGVSAQGNAARIANEAGILRHGDWVLWLDADEFLNIKAGAGQVDDLVSVIGDKFGMFINWRIFGDSQNAFFPGRFISTDFTGAARLKFEEHRVIKTLFRCSPELYGFLQNGIHRPAIDPNAGLGLDSFLNGNGHIPEDSGIHRDWFSGQDNSNNYAVTLRDFGWKVAQINHYCIRTPEMFQLKRARGRGWAGNQEGSTNKRHTDGFYKRMNRNGKQDYSILRHAHAVDTEMQRLLSLPEVHEAQCMIQKRTAISVANSQFPDDSPHPSEILASKTVDRPVVTLPENERALVVKHYSKADSILEYGSGGSTALALEAKTKHIVSVESDPVWAEGIERSLRHHFPDGKFSVHYADIGPTKEWGQPKTNERFKVYHRYATSVWDRADLVQPDVVLIDGRFRTACFCATLMKTQKPVTVLFDDYADRRYYHWVSEITPVVETSGRMARFEVQPDIDMTPFLTLIAGSFVDAR